MRRMIAALGLILLLASPAMAQAPAVSEGLVVTVCGTASTAVPAAGQPYPVTVDGTGVLCVNGDGGFVITSSITRIADHTAYSIGDAISNSTTVPTTGGFTFTGACRASGGTGVITDIIITDSDDAATILQPTLFIYNQAVTAINDNAAFAVTDAEARTMVAKIIGTILLDDGAQDDLALTNLNINYNCVGSANLRWLLRADNAYDPAANSGVIQVMIKGRWTN